MEKQVVISVFKEPISWISKFDLDTIIYDKGYNAESNTSRFRIDFSQNWKPSVTEVFDLVTRENFIRSRIKRSNVEIFHLINDPIGREAYTYLYHIVKNYKCLAEITFFLQGNPFIHSPDILDFINCNYAEPTTLTSHYKENHGQEHEDMCVTLEKCKKQVKYGVGAYHPAFGRLPGAWHEIFPTTPLPNPFYYGYAAMWAVPGSFIRKRSQAFYERLLNIVSRIDGWVFELLWNYIFQDPVRYPDFTQPLRTKWPIF